jgi:hypothetical protein
MALKVVTVVWFGACPAGLWLADTERRASEQFAADLIA